MNAVAAQQPLRNREIALIHVAKKQLALTDESYRDILNRVAGVDSSSQLDARGRAKILDEFKRLGWRYKKAAPKRAGDRRQAQTMIARKARALWISLYRLGEIENPSEGALASFARRQTGVDDLGWITPDQGDKLIEALKSRCARAGFDATDKRVRELMPAEMRREPGAMTRGFNALLIEAQWAMLISLGVMKTGSFARLDTWLANNGLPCGHQVYLSEGQQIRAIHKLGEWIQRERAKRVSAIDPAPGN